MAKKAKVKKEKKVIELRKPKGKGTDITLESLQAQIGALKLEISKLTKTK